MAHNYAILRVAQEFTVKIAQHGIVVDQERNCIRYKLNQVTFKPYTPATIIRRELRKMIREIEAQQRNESQEKLL